MTRFPNPNLANNARSESTSSNPLPLRGGDPVDDLLVLFHLAENFHLRADTEGVEGFDDFENPCLQVLVERTQLFEAALGIEGNADPALFEDERLRVFGDAFQQLGISPGASSFQHFSFQSFSFYHSVLRFSGSCSWRSG